MSKIKNRDELSDFLDILDEFMDLDDCQFSFEELSTAANTFLETAKGTEARSLFKSLDDGVNSFAEWVVETIDRGHDGVSVGEYLRKFRGATWPKATVSEANRANVPDDGTQGNETIHVRIDLFPCVLATPPREKLSLGSTS